MNGQKYIEKCEKYLSEGLSEEEVLVRLNLELEKEDLQKCKSKDK